MINHARGDVEVSLDGMRYALRPTFEALNAIESQTGMSVLTLAEHFAQGNVRLEDIVSILEIGIQAGSAVTLHKQEIGNAIVKAGITASLTAIATFLNIALTGVVEVINE